MDAAIVSVETCDVSIIGGGILGLAVAARVARRGYHAALFRLGNHGLPRADTLRNQGWLQSGLMYVGKLGKDRQRGRRLARQMYFAGRTMLKGLGLTVPNGVDSGVLCVHGDKDAGNLVDDARSFGIEPLVRELSESDAQRRLGPLFEEKRKYFSIPDAPFPEGEVLRRLRAEAADAGTAFIESPTPVRLHRDVRSPSGIVIECDGRLIHSQAVILAAGAGCYDLLNSLGINPRMKIQQTPLLVVEGDGVVSVPIFVHRPGEFSFVLHPPEPNMLPAGAFVVATSLVNEDITCLPYEQRSIPRVDVDTFHGLLPKHLQSLAEKNSRFTAGYEVVPDGVKDEYGDELHYVEPWVEWIEPEQKLKMLLAMPGRATMGVVTADAVLDRLEDATSGIGEPTNGSLKSGFTGQWDDGIYMHFHRHYAFDDRERPSEGN